MPNAKARSMKSVVNSTSNPNSNSTYERELSPDKDADEIIRVGKWHPLANRIITNGKWKWYRYNGKIVAYTFREAAEIEEHQNAVDEKRLAELQEMFSPLPSLNGDEKKKMKSYTLIEFDVELKSGNSEGGN
jgi:hypothetical protein